MNTKDRIKLYTAIALLFCAAGITLYRYGAPTNIAFANYPEYILSPLLDQELNKAVNITILPWNDKSGKELKNFDAVIFFGMGLNFTDEQKKILDNLKTPVYVTASTKQETRIGTFTEAELDQLRLYLGGGKENFRRMIDYIRYEVHGKRIFAPKPEPPLPREDKPFFHVKEENRFANYKEYMEFYTKRPEYNASYPVVLLASINGADGHEELIMALEKKNISVVAKSGTGGLLKLAEEIKPSMIIYQPHGRLGMMSGDPDATLKSLQELNIPLVCPIKVNEKYEAYLEDQRGMTGGMLSQSVTMPELDGGIIPFTLSALFPDKRGLMVHRMIPARLDRFASLVSKFLKLKQMPNSEKKIGIVYYKGPGMNALVAGGLEVAPSLLATLRKLKSEGYDTGELPETPEKLAEIIQANGAVYNDYAKGAEEAFLAKATTVKITNAEYRQWVQKALPGKLFGEVVERYGDFPPEMKLGHIRFGNIVLIPQTAAGEGDDESKVIHGVKMAPPHSYIATYLWLRYGFNANAIMHFGTHGSLEFTPWKQIALSDYDWPDILVGDMPHFYLYTIDNIGEAVIAKRRSYATMISHLTPPFMLSDLHGPMAELDEKLHNYESVEDAMLKAEYAKAIVEIARREHYDNDLSLSEDFKNGKMTQDDFTKLHTYVHEVENTKVTRGVYVIGRPYSEAEATEMTTLMMVDVVADRLFRLDEEAGKVTSEKRDDAIFYEKNYLKPAREHVAKVLADPKSVKPLPKLVADKAAEAKRPPMGMSASLDEMKKMMETGKFADGKDIPPMMMEAMKKDGGAMGSPRGNRPVPPPKPTLEEEITNTRSNLLKSTEMELDAMVNAFNGGYLPPTSGGDPVGNPSTVPTGKNLYGIDPERTPTPESFAVGQKLAQALIDAKLKSEGKYPRKVAFTLWGGEFIRTQGVNIGEIFYLLGCEPIWDSRKRVQDVRLIPSDKLKRPRIDVVVQTSGQFRGIASSRMKLIDKAVQLAAEAEEEENFVREGSLLVAKALVEAGLSPAQAKEYQNARIFGGANGGYGTGIQGMVQASGNWEDTAAIAETYIHNMNTIYSDNHWNENVQGLFRAALQNTDAVVQSRSSNSWGPLSLDHVYEFTGGINLAVKNVTGKDPSAYFNDLRTPGRAKIQEVSEAIMVEAHSSILNPKYISEMMQEGPSALQSFAAVFENSFGWETMKPDAVKDHLWDKYKEVYVDDSLKLGVPQAFESKNPYAM
ncbi:MAG: cobaltochelatase subunit CobN, partial [Victivallales bacterium]|nr:cobaltochelatase subunit CobN [Victivallales bacterium]